MISDFSIIIGWLYPALLTYNSVNFKHNVLCVHTNKKSVDFNLPVYAFHSISLSEYI